ncbi:hypothetical protein ACTTAI_08540 [Rhodobacter capsulatus]|uniref:hypothetical protein n=1 Tax=Rhodobacter capsulatus TaxID=1061 RepID=UPI004026659A
MLDIASGKPQLLRKSGDDADLDFERDLLVYSVAGMACPLFEVMPISITAGPRNMALAM